MTNSNYLALRGEQSLRIKVAKVKASTSSLSEKCLHLDNVHFAFVTQCHDRILVVISQTALECYNPSIISS